MYIGLYKIWELKGQIDNQWKTEKHWHLERNFGGDLWQWEKKINSENNNLNFLLLQCDGTLQSKQNKFALYREI